MILFDYSYAFALQTDLPLRAVIALPLPQMIATLAVLIIAHEAIHGITFMRLNRGRPDFRVRYGVKWRHLAPYASPVGPMSASIY